MASLGSSIRSAARATFSAYRRLPVRWRLGGGSALLTLVILAGFAGAADVLIERQVSNQFVAKMNSKAARLPEAVQAKVQYGQFACFSDLSEIAAGRQRPDPPVQPDREAPLLAADQFGRRDAREQTGLHPPDPGRDLSRARLSRHRSTPLLEER